MEPTRRGLCHLLCLSVMLAAPAQEPSAETPEYAEIEPLAERSLLLAWARQGGLLAAAGEHGHILTSRDAGRTRKQALVPTRATLTGIYFHDESLGWAVGHDATILRTRDGGDTWERIYYAPEEERPFLDVWFRESYRFTTTPPRAIRPPAS